MCGIAGVWSEDTQRAVSAVRAMNAFQARRGPDGEGLNTFGPITLGHRRLAIIDRSPQGNQPLGFNNGKLQISFNGEIYNYLSLREELLKKGYVFRTKTDTEVILALYDKYGPPAFGMFRGMFAFALWDERNQKLFLVKDRCGIKPLYYANIPPRELVFASTVGAIENSGFMPFSKDLEAAIFFLIFGFIPLPWTTYKEIKAVPWGSYLVRHGDGREEIISYHDTLRPFEQKKEIDFDGATQEIRRIVEEAVDLHLISDAPLGVFLSGGLDSSAIAAVAATKRNDPLTTLAVDFEEAEFSEKKWRDMVVSKIKSDHKEVLFRKKDFEDSLPDIFSAMDQPTVDGINTYTIAKAAREAGLTVVLSGLGSDELFGGYPTFRRAPMLSLLESFPGGAFLGGTLGSFNPRYKKLVFLRMKHPLGLYLAARGLFTPEEVAEQLHISEKDVWDGLDKIAQTLPHERLSKLSPRDQMSWLEFYFYLQSQLLKDTDVMAMRHSIEARVPFLDRELVEYVSSLPSSLKLKGKWNKPLLVKAIDDLIPSSVYDRPKMGFTFPFTRWFKELGKQFSMNETTRHAYDEFLRGGHWSHFWANVVLEKFM